MRGTLLSKNECVGDSETYSASWKNHFQIKLTDNLLHSSRGLPLRYLQVSGQCLPGGGCLNLKPLSLCGLSINKMASWATIWGLQLNFSFSYFGEKFPLPSRCPWSPPKQISFTPCSPYILSYTSPNVSLKCVEICPGISVWFSKRYLDLFRQWTPSGLRKHFHTNFFSFFTLQLNPDTHTTIHHVFWKCQLEWRKSGGISSHSCPSQQCSP